MKSLYHHLKNSAKKRGIPFSLTLTDINELTIPITCPVLGIPLKHNRERPSDDSISIDRIDSKKGYTKDNIIVVSMKANRLKSDATLSDMRKLVEFYEQLERDNETK